MNNFAATVAAVIVGNMLCWAMQFGLAFVHTDAWVAILLGVLVAAFCAMVYRVHNALREDK